MGRRKKEEVVEEVVTPMIETAMNEPVEIMEEPKGKTETILKKIASPTSKVNVRAEASGKVLFTIDNGSEVLVEDEKDGWCKITGFVMAELIKDL